MNKISIFLQNSVVIAFKITRRLASFLKRVFDRKTILFVSKQKIKSYSISPVMQIVLLIALLWTGSIFGKSLQYNSLIKRKSAEIINLQKANQQFEAEIESLNFNLQKINSYFTTISGYQNPNIATDKHNIDTKIKEIFGSTSLSSQDKEIATKIADSNLILDNIKNATIKRIDDLQQKIALADIIFSDNKVFLKKAPNFNNNGQKKVISLNNENDLTKGQGGPFQQITNTARFFNTRDLIFGGNHRVNIKNEIEYLANLEKFIHKAPFAAPMKNYYVSSGFGGRSDPIRGVSSKHNGMDFVGKIGAKILSPSSGKVIFAGKFGSYGNMIILDHGYGLTTRYGHLSQINVNKGDNVETGQIIAAEGTSGRSTGAHLHYEVRYKNIPMNPKKFLQAGQEIFNTDQNKFNNVKI